jgi:hypothetical protein
MIDIAKQSAVWVLYDQAWLHCLTLVHNGHKDWRLPTEDEYRDYKFNEAWYNDDPWRDDVSKWYSIPVRDCND